ncbi:protein toll isoform X2 [Zootermopsis nevadensis]|uniref:Protein toll n=2 Tax=Zootermopsis nevadensis TaxID=136037 RepID=A0A067R3H7_ZOONE|nr:protein toll isoform X2 [Zootermopsis nevadensis]XP_021930930.1 protein toll isoform X2 [Zootermopsis nevadensis]XP_021930931.1 protein toll isoform X2 [Zootermopsis nevadensis]XP_021930932.1 protein toll isoform X2 [Zootermopsis nevadensis]XP_021930933.1 protein toll isoform X2 [Zootermopsis nevadensis]KDR13629.1 Protein toll [Zootermopsis nevadensis]
MLVTMRQLMLAAVLAVNTVSSDNSCPVLRKCRCDKNVKGDLDLWCSHVPQKVLLHAKLVPENMLNLQCLSMTWMDYELLSGLNVGSIPLVAFTFCPLPNMSLYQMLLSVGASGVESLVFQNGNLSDPLESSFLEGLTNLKTLILHSNGITSLPEELFQGMTALQYLDLKDNALQLPLHVFDSLSNLQTLELGGNQMTRLEVGIFRNLSRLARLNLWGNNLQNLTQDVFTGLSSLEFLDLSSNKLTSISADLFHMMPKLKEITMPGNNFTSLPHDLFTSTSSLTKLGLYNNRQQLQHIPPGLLANLTNLLEVYLNMCGITQVPGDIFWGSLAIVNISLHGNLLTTLPEELFRDTVSLRNLKLGNNQLQTLPDGVFFGLGKLEALELDHNHLTSITGDLLKDLRRLERLNLEHNKLQHIAVRAFTHVPGLKDLTLSHNRLSLSGPQTEIGEVQSVLSACVQLEKLFVSNNSIKTVFSDWVLTLLNLRTLDLSHNLISNLTLEDMQFLSNSITVDLTYNSISSVDLQNLELVASAQVPHRHLPKREILLEGNPLMCDCKLYDLLRYFEDRLEPEARSMFEIIPGNLTCAAPPEWSGIAVNHLSSVKIQCPLPQLGDCPNPCTCSGRPADSALVVDCSGLKLSQSPASLPDPLKLNKSVLWPRRLRLNHTELWLKRNGIVKFPWNTAPGYSRVTKLYLSYNNISTFVAEQVPPHLQVLELDHNNLTQLDASILQAFGNKTGLQHITLHANPWHCDCEARGIITFLQEHFTQVAYLPNVTCGDGSGRSLSNLTFSDICPVSSTTIVTMSIIIALSGIIVGISVALYYYYQNEVKVWLYARGLCLWFVTEEELDKEKLYDAFISYSHRDEEFVVNHLVPGLEGGTTQFKLCLHYRDWIAGEWIPNQIARSVEDSRRTLVVLSPSFLESVWGRMEFRTAHSQALSEGRARVIVLLYGDVGPMEQLDPELRAYLSMNTYVKWGDPWFWDKLRYALPHPQKVGERGMELNPRRKVKDDKLELINPSIPPSATTTTFTHTPMTQSSIPFRAAPVTNGDT